MLPDGFGQIVKLVAHSDSYFIFGVLAKSHCFGYKHFIDSISCKYLIVYDKCFMYLSDGKHGASAPITRQDQMRYAQGCDSPEFTIASGKI